MKKAIDTVTTNSIQEDEEGTNLNTKGINVNYVKHYNSKYKTSDQKQSMPEFTMNHTTMTGKCYCQLDNDSEISDYSSLLWDSSVNYNEDVKYEIVSVG